MNSDFCSVQHLHHLRPSETNIRDFFSPDSRLKAKVSTHSLFKLIHGLQSCSCCSWKTKQTSSVLFTVRLKKNCLYYLPDYLWFIIFHRSVSSEEERAATAVIHYQFICGFYLLIVWFEHGKIIVFKFFNVWFKQKKITKQFGFKLESGPESVVFILNTTKTGTKHSLILKK